MAKRTGECRDCGATIVSGERGRVPWRCDGCKKVAQAAAYDRWAVANPERRRALDRRYKAQARYGLTPDEINERAATQGGCLICGSQLPRGVGRWHVDHDHACCSGHYSCGACVRGVLCSPCNMGLGQFRDDPEVLRRAADYIESYRR